MNSGKWFSAQEWYSVGATKKWENDPMWGKLDEPLKMFRTAARNTRLFGYAGPSTAKATEAFTKYIITDMYAKGVQGMSAEDAVKWAEGEDRKSTRLNSSHLGISYAVFCLKKKKNNEAQRA